MSNIADLQAKLDAAQARVKELEYQNAILDSQITSDCKGFVKSDTQLTAAQERIAQLEQVLRDHGICPRCGTDTHGMPFHTCNAPAQKEGTKCRRRGRND